MMAPMTRFRQQAIAWLCAAVTCALFATPSQARRSPQKFLYEITQVKLASGIPAAVKSRAKDRLAVAIDKHDRLIGELSGDAPDPDKNPKAYKAYLRKHRLRAFKVNLEIESYRSTVEPAAAPKTGKQIVVHVALRLFGETIPDRRMAFTGDGSATIKVEVGSHVREADSLYAEKQAVDLAIAAAITHSIEKLEGKAPTSRRTRQKN